MKITDTPASDFQNIISCKISTPIGHLIAVANKKGIQKLTFEDQFTADTKTCEKEESPSLYDSSNPMSAFFYQLESEILNYFEGALQHFSTPCDLQGTEFQVAVWKALLKIPYGSTISYQFLAKEIGSIQSVRAVAAANAKNPVLLLIPCHRVIGANGKLIGYSGGLTRKDWLLAHELRNHGQQRLFY